MAHVVAGVVEHPHEMEHRRDRHTHSDQQIRAYAAYSHGVERRRGFEHKRHEGHEHQRRDYMGAFLHGAVPQHKFAPSGVTEADVAAQQPEHYTAYRYADQQSHTDNYEEISGLFDRMVTFKSGKSQQPVYGVKKPSGEFV